MFRTTTRAVQSIELSRSFATSSARRDTKLSRLQDRAVLGIRGRDAAKFLQGLVSNDVYKLGSHEAGKLPLLFAAILKPDGRLLHDIFLHVDRSSTTDEPAFWLEHEASHTEQLRAYLKRHILRSKVKVSPPSGEEHVFAAWHSGDTTPSETSWDSFVRSNDIGQDPRAPNMGHRWVSAAEQVEPLNLEELDKSYHHLHRLLNGVPENEADWSSLPLESNLDLMNGVDYKKGCYVGQELTARTHHRGVVRKRGVIVRLYQDGEEFASEPNEPVPAEAQLRPAPGLYTTPTPGSSLIRTTATRTRIRSSGRLGSTLPVLTDRGSSFTLGCASLRLDHIGNELFTIAKVAGEKSGTASIEEATTDSTLVQEDDAIEWRVKAFMPEWLQEKLDSESRAS